MSGKELCVICNGFDKHHGMAVNMLTLDWGCMAVREQNDVYSDLAMMVT